MNDIYDLVINFSSKIVEMQDEIIMQTIQNIGGEEFHQITVDKNKVKEALCDYVKKQNNKADFVEVVRCKNCKHANEYGTICRYSVGRAVEPEHFCSYGERRKKE